jgi:hypothetical protein
MFLGPISVLGFCLTSSKYQMVSSGMKLAPALISGQNPIFKIAFKNNKKQF